MLVVMILQATSSLNNGGNDDLEPTPTDQWIFLGGDLDYMQPDMAAAGMNVVVQFLGTNFGTNSTVITDSADFTVGPIVVTDTTGGVTANRWSYINNIILY